MGQDKMSFLRAALKKKEQENNLEKDKLKEPSENLNPGKNKLLY